MKQLPEMMWNSKLHTVCYTWTKKSSATLSRPTARWLGSCKLRSAERKEEVWERDSENRARSREALLPGHMSSRHLREWFVETTDTCSLPSFLIELQDLDLDPAMRAKEPRSVRVLAYRIRSLAEWHQLYPGLSWWEDSFIRSILLRMF